MGDMGWGKGIPFHWGPLSTYQFVKIVIFQHFNFVGWDRGRYFLKHYPETQ